MTRRGPVTAGDQPSGVRLAELVAALALAASRRWLAFPSVARRRRHVPPDGRP